MTKLLLFVNRYFEKKSKIVSTIVMLFTIILFVIPTNIFYVSYDCLFMYFLGGVGVLEGYFYLPYVTLIAISFIIAILIPVLSYKFCKFLPLVSLSLIFPIYYTCDVIHFYTVILANEIENGAEVIIGTSLPYTEGQLLYSIFYLVAVFIILMYLILLGISFIFKKIAD